MSKCTFWLASLLTAVGCGPGAPSRPDGGGGVIIDAPPSENDVDARPPGDPDQDGIPNARDNCPETANANQIDGDFDGAGDVCDNCPGTDNPAQLDTDDDGIGNACDNCPEAKNQAQADGDGDSVGDTCDCDPDDASVAAFLVVDSTLATDQGLFSPAAGFAQDNWTYNAAYRQTALADNREDASFLVAGMPLDNVFVEVTAQSTEIINFDNQDVRQIFIVARAASSASKLTAIGCGIEVDDALDPTQITSIVDLSGTPDSVNTTRRAQANREALAPNFDFSLRMELSGGTMKCRSQVGPEVRNVQASGLPTQSGEIGFFTRETKALFKNLKVCRLP